MKLKKDLDELIRAEVISPETAEKIVNFYTVKDQQSSNQLFVVFGVLGALLIGMGIILILAHNWDQLSRATKTFFAFLPLVIGQVLGGYVLFNKRQSETWRESTATFIFCAVGACLALVSQIYNMPGTMTGFLFTWMLLCLPLIYVLTSSMASLFYLTGITYYGCAAGYWNDDGGNAYLYWWLLLGAMPFYYYLLVKKRGSNNLGFHHWFIALSIIIVLGTVSRSAATLMSVAYFSLLGFYSAFGESGPLKKDLTFYNAYAVLGSFGTVFMLLTFSFDGFWNTLREENRSLTEFWGTPEAIVSFIITALAAWLFYRHHKNKPLRNMRPTAPIFILFVFIFILGMSSPIALILINIILLAVGILTIREGALKNHLGLLNYGLLIITALIICRFFDTNINFVLRGLLFVAVGIGFFVANYMILKRRKRAQ